MTANKIVKEAGFEPVGAGFTISCNGAAQDIIDQIPKETKFVKCYAIGGDVTFNVNDDASANGPGYIQAGSQTTIHVFGATKVSIYGESGSYAGILLYG